MCDPLALDAAIIPVTGGFGKPKTSHLLIFPQSLAKTTPFNR